jgi:hypothetical protein
MQRRGEEMTKIYHKVIESCYQCPAVVSLFGMRRCNELRKEDGNSLGTLGVFPGCPLPDAPRLLASEGIPIDEAKKSLGFYDYEEPANPCQSCKDKKAEYCFMGDFCCPEYLAYMKSQNKRKSPESETFQWADDGDGDDE